MVFALGALNGNSQTLCFHYDIVMSRHRKHGTTLTQHAGLPVVEMDASHLCAAREVESQEGGRIHTAPEKYEDFFSRCLPPDRVGAEALHLHVKYTREISWDHGTLQVYSVCPHIHATPQHLVVGHSLSDRRKPRVGTW